MCPWGTRGGWRAWEVIAAATIVSALVAVSGFAAFHLLRLRGEVATLAAPGILVDVDGRTIHVSATGEGPTVVMLAGAGTVAPVYDFVPLRAAFGDEVRTVVIEQSGYGYSDIGGTPRDSDAVVAELRTALRETREAPPYVLAAHSMSGLTALAWAQAYPEEVTAIIGLDMATPATFTDADEDGTLRRAGIGHLGSTLGWQRIAGVFAEPDDAGLTDRQATQQHILFLRNAVNDVTVRELRDAFANAREFDDVTVGVPLLMFSSDGRDMPPSWGEDQRAFAEDQGAVTVELPCGHAVHRCEPDLIAADTLAFLGS